MRAGYMTFDAIGHQVAIAGRVTDGKSGQPIPGAVVTLTNVPPALQSRLLTLAATRAAVWRTLLQRPDRTRTAPDGGYHFFDLPVGHYELSVVVPGGKYQPATSSVEVSASQSGEIQMKVVNIQATA